MVARYFYPGTQLVMPDTPSFIPAVPQLFFELAQAKGGQLINGTISPAERAAFQNPARFGASVLRPTDPAVQAAAQKCV